ELPLVDRLLTAAVLVDLGLEQREQLRVEQRQIDEYVRARDLDRLPLLQPPAADQARQPVVVGVDQVGAPERRAETAEVLAAAVDEAGRGGAERRRRGHGLR